MPAKPDARRLKEICEVESVPTLRSVVTRVLAALDGDTDLAGVSHLISEDPAITAQVLRISNSVFYNASGLSTTSVHDAVSRIGGAQVRNLVVSLGVVDAFDDLHAGFDYAGFWKHSFTTALAAGEVAARSPRLRMRGSARDNPYFLAGLLHDIGTLLLCQQLGAEYLEVLEQGRSEARPLPEMEREAFGFDHQDVGAALIRRWGLPFEVAAAAQFHHQVGAAPEDSRDYVAVVHAANLIGTGRGLDPDGAPAEAERLELEALGLGESELPSLLEGVKRAAEQSELLLLIALPG